MYLCLPVVSASCDGCCLVNLCYVLIWWAGRLWWLVLGLRVDAKLYWFGVVYYVTLTFVGFRCLR